MKIQHTWQSISGQVVSVSILWSRGHECTDFDIDDLIDTIDRKLFSHITDPNHCLYHLLPPTVHQSYSLRKRQHGYQLPHIEYNLHKHSFLNRCHFNFRWPLFFCIKYHTQVCTLPFPRNSITLLLVLSPLYSLHHTVLWDLCVLCLLLSQWLWFFSQFIVFRLYAYYFSAVCVHIWTVRSHCCGGHSVLSVSVLFL